MRFSLRQQDAHFSMTFGMSMYRVGIWLNKGPNMESTSVDTASEASGVRKPYSLLVSALLEESFT